MGFYIQDDFWEACEELPEKTQDEVFGSLVRLFFTSNDNPNIKGTSKAVFIAFRDRVSLARKRSDAGKTTPDQNDGKPDAKPKPKAQARKASKRDQKPNQTTDQTGDQNEGTPEDDLLKSESESKEDLRRSPLPPLEECDNEAAAFAVEALSAFNAITGSDVRDMPGDAWCGLRRIFDAGRTIDDVRTVVEKKSTEWGDDPRMARFVRPSTLFGDKFDEYLNQREGGSNDAESSEYSATF